MLPEIAAQIVIALFRAPACELSDLTECLQVDHADWLIGCYCLCSSMGLLIFAGLWCSSLQSFSSWTFYSDWLID